MENRKGKKEKIKKLEFRRIKLILALPPWRSLSHSAHHHAEIQTQSNNCKFTIQVFKFSK